MRKRGERLEVKSLDAELGEVTAVIATMHEVDHDGDVTLPGAFDPGHAFPIGPYAHKMWDGGLPVGVGRIREVGDEAILEGQYFMDIPEARREFLTVKRLAEQGIGSWSYSYECSPPKGAHSFGQHKGQRVRFLERLHVDEASPVPRAAGLNTRTLSAKGRAGLLDRPLTWRERAEVRAIARDFALKEELRAIAANMEAYRQRRYVEVAAPSRHVQELAHKALRAAVRAAGGPRCLPPLKWFAESDRGEVVLSPLQDLRGFYLGETVWIRADLPVDVMLSTVEHEACHAAGGDEDQAQAFEREARR